MSWMAQVVVSALLGTLIAIVASFGGSHVLAPEHVPAILPSSASSTPATSTPAAPAPEEKPVAASSTPPSAPPPKKLPAEPAQPVSQPPTPAEPPQAQSSGNTSSQGTLELAQGLQTGGASSATDMVRSAVVNIICTTRASGPLESISGSGVFIDSRGVILTNSHIAQFFLLKDYSAPDFVNCVIRTGSPATAHYTAELLFMPPSWMAENAYKIVQNDPTGNGEHDYALLLVTGTSSPSVSLPASFPALPISTAPPTAGESVLLAAYPAGFLGGITVANSLYETSADATVGDLYTFLSNTLDLFSVGGTVVAQKGSSGGAVTSQSGTLLGLIVTATESASTASRDLRAISTPYLISDFEKESGTPLAAFLNGDVVAEAANFSLTIAPTLRAELEAALQGN